MGKWTNEADKQAAIKTMASRDALTRVAYWARARGYDTHDDWRAITRLIVATEKPTSIKLPLPFPLLHNNAITRYLFGKTDRPKVTEQVRARVLDYIAASAKVLDVRHPKATVPRYKLSELIDEGKTLVNRSMAAPKKQYPTAALIALGILILWNPK